MAFGSLPGVLLLLAGCAPPQDGEVGSMAPALELPLLRPAVGDCQPATPPFSSRCPGEEGGQWRLHDGLGRVQVINIWASWCLPCRLEMPALQRLSEQLGQERFSVVAISIDESVPQVSEFIYRYSIRLPVPLDPAGVVTSEKLSVDRYPATLIVAADGEVVERIEGQREWDQPEWVEAVRAVAAAGL